MTALAAPLAWLSRYAHWLHLRWPAGVPEPLPAVDADGGTRVPGLLVVGDLTGVPLLKFALDSGARAAQRCVRELAGAPPAGAEVLDVAIIGGGVAGLAAARELAGSGLRFAIIESNQRLATLANFPAGKPIFAYPTAMRPAGALQVSAGSKEELLAELEGQLAGLDLPLRSGVATHVERRGAQLAVMLASGEPVLARRVIVAIGRSGNFRRLGVPGEDLPLVVNRLHDPKHHAGQDVVVAGGGDSACEAAVACAEAGARVVLVHRGADLARAKPENAARVLALAQAGRLRLLLGTRLERIEADAVLATAGGNALRLPAQAVLALIGREAPLGFFRRSGVPITGERSLPAYAGLIAFLLAIAGLYGWKSLGWGGGVAWLQPATWLAGWAADPQSLAGVLLHSASSPSFWVTLAYSSAVVGFGIDRMRRRRTPYVRVQTGTLMAIQVLPLFLIPELLLPWLGANDLLPQAVRDNLFPGDSWWRAYGFILAWPLMAWNVFTEQPYAWWLAISFVQTFVIIPLIVWRWGKGAYCGWVCSCGALAETMGDRHRQKMPHGKAWNRLNLVGQVILATAAVILVLHIISWTAPGAVSPAWLQEATMRGYWKHAVDWLLAGALGTGLYFWLSGRVWCRFACPLAAWMHIVARFSRFRIVVEQKKCISCNACTSVCHQGIDIMNFANKGLHMEDPECVRCSACVQACPTGVLAFGRLDADGRVAALDRLDARGAGRS